MGKTEQETRAKSHNKAREAVGKQKRRVQSPEEDTVLERAQSAEQTL